MRSFVTTVERLGYRVCGVFLLDSIFVSDASKFIAGIMACLSAMVQLGWWFLFDFFKLMNH
jgi:GPN-loop GTPase